MVRRWKDGKIILDWSMRKKQGVKESQSKEQVRIAKKMKEEGMSNEIISRLTELSLDKIIKL